MDVNLYATLRAIAGQKTVQVDLPPEATANRLVEMVVDRYPDLRRELLDEDNRFHDHMKLFINGREAIYLEHKFDTVIRPGDKIDIFPPTGGG